MVKYVVDLPHNCESRREERSQSDNSTIAITVRTEDVRFKNQCTMIARRDLRTDSKGSNPFSESASSRGSSQQR